MDSPFFMRGGGLSMKKHPAKRAMPKDCCSSLGEFQEVLRRLIEIIARKMADEIVRYPDATNEAIEKRHSGQCVSHEFPLAFRTPSRNARKKGRPGSGPSK
jgi:hypothetical protein